jgi:predicted transcriptional regulator
MEKLHLVLKIARQVEGEYIFINVLKAFTDVDKMRSYANDLRIPPTEIVNDIPCMVEIGIIQDVEVE